VQGNLRRAWLALALGSGLLVGCERAAVRSNYPPDVLFANRRPVAGKAETARPLLASNEPAVPELPESALASAPRGQFSAAKAGLMQTAEQPPAPGKSGG
jgi:hypothetical protein